MSAAEALGFLALLSTMGKGGGSPTPEPPLPPWTGPVPPIPPPGDVTPVGPVAPPWPGTLPPDLPSFPGPGWEYDEPVSSPVVQRAWALLPTLWKAGTPGQHMTEMTAGHWVTYLGEWMAGHKKGVTAWRVKAGAIAPPAADAARRRGAAPPARAPGAPPAPGVPVTYKPPTYAPTPEQRPAPTLISTGADVQRALNVLGYGPLTEDGKLGPKSRAAVLRFQKDHPPLTQDGLAGANTKAALSNALAARA